MTLEAKLQALATEWQTKHSGALTQAKAETNDDAYTSWMRVAATIREHMIELEALLAERREPPLAAEGPDAASCAYEAQHNPGFRCPACGVVAAAPSLHKEGPRLFDSPEPCPRCGEPLNKHQHSREEGCILKERAGGERGKLAAWMIENSFATGHGDTFEDLLKELSWQVKELRAASPAGRAEQERK